MESSQFTRDDGEECNSNESGWTMYLASPGNSDDFKANDSGESNVEDGSGYSNGRSSCRSKGDYRNYGEGDYDSLASDASTGPAHVKVLNGKEKKSHGKNDSSRNEHNKDEKEESHTSCNKKVGRTKKGEEKTTRRGYNKRRSSSRTSFW